MGVFWTLIIRWLKGRYLASGLFCILSMVLIISCQSSPGPNGSVATSSKNIKICTIDDLSGPFSIMATPKTYGYKLAVEEVNANGGVNGQQLELITYDGQSDVKRYQELAQRCVLENNANVVMAGYTGAEREAARNEFVKSKVIYWHNNQGEGGIANRYSFFSGPTPEQQVLPGIKYMIEKFGPRMTYIGADYNFCRAIGAWTRTASNLYGGKIEMEEYFPFEVSQWSSVINKIQGIKPDFQVHCLVGAEQVQFYPQAQSAGLKIPTFSNVTVADGYEHKRFSAPSLANMYVSPAYIEDVPGKTSQEFAKKIRKIAPDTPYVNEHARFGYIAVKAMAQAWQKAGTTDTEAVIDVLESGEIQDGSSDLPWKLLPNHHAAMKTFLFKVDNSHKLELVKELGYTEPKFLDEIGIDLEGKDKAVNKSFLPQDNPDWKKFFSK